MFNLFEYIPPMEINDSGILQYSTKAYEAPEDISEEVSSEIDEVNQETDKRMGYSNEESEGEIQSDDTSDQPDNSSSNEEDYSESSDDENVDEDSYSDEEDLDSPDVMDAGEQPDDGEYIKCKRIHDNTIKLLDVVSLSKDSFEKRCNKCDSVEQSKDYHRIISTFDSLISAINFTLINKFINGKYEDLIRCYVSLVRVFDIITRMTVNFVDKYFTEKNET